MQDASALKVVVNLPRGFSRHLARAAQDELKIAQEKWGLKLDEERQARVLLMANRQLLGKVAASYQVPWTLDDAYVVVQVGKPVEDARMVTLPQDTKNVADVYLIRSNSTWVLDDAEELSMDSVPLDEFASRVESDLEAWLRTAVFYGVGSYV